MIEIKKEDWVRNLVANEQLIIQNKMQIMMAEKVIALCEEKIAEFKEAENAPLPSN